MEVRVLALRDLASGRPGRRGRAEAAAQKVSGRGGRRGPLTRYSVSPAAERHAAAGGWEGVRVAGTAEGLAAPPAGASWGRGAPAAPGAWRWVGPGLWPRIASLPPPVAVRGALPLGPPRPVCPATLVSVHSGVFSGGAWSTGVSGATVRGTKAIQLGALPPLSVCEVVTLGHYSQGNGSSLSLNK